jgi:hypothetical protein
MSASETVTEAGLSRGWQRGEQAGRAGHLGAVDEWHRENAAVRVFYTRRGAVRTGWLREGNRDWIRIDGQDKAEEIVRYLKTRVPVMSCTRGSRGWRRVRKLPGKPRAVVNPPHIRADLKHHLDVFVCKDAESQLFPAQRGGCHLNDRLFRVATASAPTATA